MFQWMAFPVGLILMGLGCRTISPDAGVSPEQGRKLTGGGEVKTVSDRFQCTNVWFVRAASKPPIIDGKLDEVWAQSGPHRFVWLTGSPKGEAAPAEATDGYMLCDRENLYVAILCHTPDTRRLVSGSKPTVRDAINWDGDYVEVLLDPNRRRDGGFHFVVDPAGTFGDIIHDSLRYSAVGGEFGDYAPWTSEGVEYKVGIGQDSYCVEMKIPFKSLGLNGSQIGRFWGVSLNRFNPRGGEDTAIAFTGVGESFHGVAHFGIAILECGDPSYKPAP
jgi:hypothetical protein